MQRHDASLLNEIMIGLEQDVTFGFVFSVPNIHPEGTERS